MKLFQKVGAALTGARNLATGSQQEPEEDMGGFGPPGGVVWTTPVDVLSDRPKAAPPAFSDMPIRISVTDRPTAPAVADHAAPAATAVAPELEEVVSLVRTAARSESMSTDISGAAEISGFVAACLVDSDSGFMLASEGGDNMDLDAEAALNTQVVKAEHEVIEALDLDDHIEDILITMGRQLHFIRPLEKSPSVFLYVCLDKKAANLGMARMQVNKIESGLKL